MRAHQPTPLKSLVFTLFSFGLFINQGSLQFIDGFACEDQTCGTGARELAFLCCEVEVNVCVHARDLRFVCCSRSVILHSYVKQTAHNFCSGNFSK